MYVHVEVLEGHGCLVGLGAHVEDKIVVRVGEPHATKGAAGMPSTTLDAPILNMPVGIAIPDKLSGRIKHQITKHAVHRDMDKFQLRLYVLQHDGNETKWLGIVAFRLLCLTGGYVLERWVPMKPATVTPPGDLRLRVVVRDTEADAVAVLHQPRLQVHSQPTEGCCCDICDPHFKLANPIIAYFDFDEKHLLPGKLSRAAVVGCAVT